MIVPMKKVTLLCLEADRDRTLVRLRELGVLHLSPIVPPKSATLEARRQERDTAKKALSWLDAQPDRPSGPGPDGSPADADPGALAADLTALVARRRKTSERIAELERERSAAAVFGDFDPAAVRRLASSGISVRFFRARADVPFEPPAGVVALELGADVWGPLVTAISMGPVPVDAVEVALPDRPLGAIERELREQAAGAVETDKRLRALRGARSLIETHIQALDDSVAFLDARAGMGVGDRIAYLQGFCPSDTVSALEREAGKAGWGIRAEDPDPVERVPVQIRTPAWIRPIESLFRFIDILPGYREADVSGSFLVFMSIFFAMIIGDAGYGAVFLVLTRLARRKWRRAPAAPFTLMTVFSAGTIVWGIATGVYFGITGVPGPLKSLRIDWLTDTKNVMGLCLWLGAMHLSVAHIWNAVRMAGSLQAIAQAGWLAIVWTMFFAGRMLLLGIAFPVWFIPVSVAGLVAVVVFMTPIARMKADWINHAMLPLTLMSNFGDILSYLRLFALGVASVQLASAFNKIIGESIGFSGPVSAFFAALLLFAGHTVNVVLSLMSVLVHGIRLNALEFSMHMGLEWSGIRYSPFALRLAGSRASDAGESDGRALRAGSNPLV